MDQNISLARAVGIIRKHLVAIIIWGILLGVGAWSVATFVMTPKYSAEAQLLVNRKNDTTPNGAQYADQQADIQMITTYKDIITNQVVLEKVSNELANPGREVVKPAVKAKYERDVTGHKVLVRAAEPAVTKSSSAKAYDVPAGQLKKMIGISNQQNSQVFAVSVKANDPKEAARIANLTAQVFKKRIKDIMSVNNVTIVSKAVENPNKVAPRTTLLTAAGLLAGLLIGLTYAFVRELTDRTVKDESYLAETLDLTNLGHVSRITSAGRLTGSHRISSHGDENLSRGSSRRTSSRV
ncbi:YveK family protein [Furfurilactobacillus siliginis]|uniref:Capsular polysaccharide biosynthesis protein CpsC n=1 Tax=Furfurilactobacillus siliginis TaxID=348151 RepID=A0A0R2LD81_9LACO|nr:Wzz/FepE/Etk N-terminal domain-containing protein [Furfurilactobacillus siliginis]KRN96567.1 chain length determinant protein [Furfurilactobacillus siliginis]GEK29025.1 exopolysaccharide biosynthesis protein [Furfurilactobacillus siliginis]